METQTGSSKDIGERHRAFCENYPSAATRVCGHDWHYREAGSSDNAAVLLLPGALGRSETGFEYIAALAPHLHVIAPGYPASTRTMTELADGAAALLEARGIRQAHVIGGSFGGLVAQALLGRHPQKVKRIVLSDTSPPVPHRALRMRLAAALIRRLPHRFIRSVVGIGVHRYVSALPQDTRRFWHHHFRETLAAMSNEEIEARAHAWVEFDTTRWPDVPPREMLILSATSDRSVSLPTFLAPFPHASMQVVKSPFGHAASVGDAAAYLRPIVTFLTEETK
jgi:pimeloyl-ACP methyl ester carboxylesterase